MIINPYIFEQVPEPLSHEAILAEFVKHNGTVQDISGEDGGRNPRNLFAVNTDPASHTVTYPKGTGGQDLGFGSSSTFTICLRFKSSVSAAENVILSNEDWATSYKGIRIDHSSSGSLRVELFTALSTSSIRGRVATYRDVNGDAVVTTTQNSLNNGSWHFVAITFDGTHSQAALRMYIDKTLSDSSNNIVNTTGDIVSPRDWKSGGRPNAASETNNMTFAEIIFYNVVKTHQELIEIEDGKIDTVGLLRYYKHEEEAGATIYNHYVTDYGNPYHGVITGASPATLRVSMGSGSKTRSFANKYGYTLSGSTIIPVNLADTTKTVANATPGFVGKVKYPVGDLVMSPLSFKPNPNGYDELNELGLTSSTTITDSSTEFLNTENHNPLFKDRVNKKFLAFYRPLRLFTGTAATGAYNAALSEMASVLTHLDIRTYLIVQSGSQSNGVGTNTLTEGDFVNPAYRNKLSYGFIANNADGVAAQVITKFNLYDADALPTAVSGRGSLIGPDASMMGDLVAANKTVFLLKYAIGSTSLLPSVLNYWHPTDMSGAGTRLYPFMRDAIQDTIAFLNSVGRTNIEVIYFSDIGESNRSATQTDFQNALEAMDAALKADIPEYNGKYVLRRGHLAFFGLVGGTSNGVRLAQDAFAAADPALRKCYNSDDCDSWDTDDVHLTIPGQELSGQRAAAAILTLMN
jgi:hypothetical protein